MPLLLAWARGKTAETSIDPTFTSPHFRTFSLTSTTLMSSVQSKVCALSLSQGKRGSLLLICFGCYRVQSYSVKTRQTD